MNKVYVISFETLSDNVYDSGVAYVFDTLEKAKIMLEQIKQDCIYSCDFTAEDFNVDSLYDLVHDLVTEDGFIIDFYDDYTKYIIEEMEVQ